MRVGVDKANTTCAEIRNVWGVAVRDDIWGVVAAVSPYSLVMDITVKI